METRYPCHRILVLVAGTPDDSVDQLIARLGLRGVGRVLRDRRVDEAQRGHDFAGLVLDESRRMMLGRRPGKVALCLAGGGTTGLYFELGALKCLADCMSPGALNRLDLYFGISAGAIGSSLLASGYSIDEVMAAFAGWPGGRLPHTNLSLLHLRHLNLRDNQRRLLAAVKELARRVLDTLGRRELPSLASWFFEYSDLVGPPFHADGIESALRRVFDLPGADQ